MQVIPQAAPCRALVHGVDLRHLERSQVAALRAHWLAHLVRAEFVYRHRWSAGMLVRRDKRCMLHAATAGYDGAPHHRG